MPGLPFPRARAQCGYSLGANLPIPCLRCQGKNHSASAARAPGSVSLRPRRSRNGRSSSSIKAAASATRKRRDSKDAATGTSTTIDGTTRRNLGRYANHSCRPNAESARSKGKVILRAIKKIRPGDEITYDYGRDYYLNVITPRGCKCDKCRQKRNAARRAREDAKAKLVSVRSRRAARQNGKAS
jgi:hypothetical protein